MKYSPTKERELLKVLANSKAFNGVEYSWKGSHHPKEHIADELTEYHFKEMEREGLVEMKSATKDGARFLITKLGQERLDESSPIRSFLIQAKAKFALGMLGLGFVWILFAEVLSPTWVCPKLPDMVHGMLSKCETLQIGEKQ